MSSPLAVDIFAEDRAHEAFLVPLVNRIAQEEGTPVAINVRSARGGHGKAVAEFRRYQTLLLKTAITRLPDLVVVAIDGNCTSFSAKKDEITGATDPQFEGTTVACCPDPHIERWYLADPPSFAEIVGCSPTLGKKKCKRDYYKRLLIETLRRGEHPVTLGGTEFAPELVAAMDLYQAGKTDRSLKAAVTDLRAVLQQARRVEQRADRMQANG